MKKILIIPLTLTLVSLLSASTLPPHPQQVFTPPKTIAALGDSINLAANSCNLWEECLEESWTTGQSSNEVESFSEKIATLPQSPKNITAYNNAQANSKVDDLPRQALLAVNQEAEFITILAGANDACSYYVKDMTPEDNFRGSIEATLELLNEKLPHSKVFVASIPDLLNLWQQGRNNPEIVTRWDEYRMCNSLLEDPNGFTLDDIQRRKEVENQIVAYNKILAEECSQAKNCLFDNNQLHSYNFTVEEISTFDGFHPSTLGQNKISTILWNDLIKIHAQILRGTTASSSVDAPIVQILNPTNGQKVSGTDFKLLVQIRNSDSLEQIYANTQLGPIDLTYDKRLSLWVLEVDTTLAPNGLKTDFSVVAVDADNNVGVSETITVEVDNSTDATEKL